MSVTMAIVLLWIGFIGTHLGLASVRVEPRLKEQLGTQAFLGLYSLVALALFVPLCWIYFANVHAGVWLWHVPVSPAMRAFLYLTMGFSLLLVVYGALRPSPASLAPGEGRLAGAFRITRQPLVIGVALLMALHLIPNASTADVAFFGGFVVFAVTGALHQDARKLHYGDEGFAQFHSETSLVPFSRGGLVPALREMGVLVWLVTIAGFFAIRGLHGSFWPH